MERQLCFSKTSQMTSMVFQLRVVAGMPRRFSTTALEYVCGSVGVVAAPHPHERVRECLLENAAVAVARGQAEYEAVVVTLGLERGRRAFGGHNPVVMGFLGIFRAKVVYGMVREDAER